ncbi:hypothetical protein [Tsukamurella sp. 1534]|uniref:hypothetical protein n=1 Tax=Tsukamurella sp. 1534 TaxID=1151061 RepID=UPI0002D2E682|nr:hypothetical protein [Tsukamurella sp. 1534]
MLRPHPAGDGALVRVRIPGGAVTPAQVETLAGLAGDGDLELTSRGNIQVRGVADPDAARDALRDAGLLPSDSHERVRNILGRPQAPGPTALDAALIARPALAELPGRFLFAIDEPSVAADVESRSGVLYLDGFPTDLPGTVESVLDAAQAFLDLRGDEWRLRDLPDGAPRVAAALGGTVVGPRDVPDVPDPPVGWFDEPDGTVTLGAGVRLGRIDGRTARFVAAVGRPVTVTPWRTLLLHGLDEGAAETVVRVLAPMGLVFDADSPWLRVSACVGDHGCARAEGDSLAHAAELVHGIDDGDRVHVVACERGCGAPRGEHRLVITSADGDE